MSKTFSENRGVEYSEDLDSLASILDFHECETKLTRSESSVDKLKLDNGGRPIEDSEVHAGDTDSSDDEDNRNCSEQKYNDFGKFAKVKLRENESKCKSNINESSRIFKKFGKREQYTSTHTLQGNTKTENVATENYCDVYGIRIINPLISSQLLKEKMSCRQTVPLDKIKHHLNNLDPSKDWIIAGVIVNKCTKTSQKGKQYCLWTLSDLKPELKTVSLFLFGKAYTKLWKTGTGVVVAVLNPSIMENKSTSNDVPALSINDADQVMMWGTSKDLGVCRAIKKNGDPCSSFVNKRQCEYCIYHVKQEYKKFTGRSELQSPSGGNLQDLKNKVLGKNEVFYGGRSFTANTVVAKQKKKMVEKDKMRMQKLGGILTSVLPSTKTKSQILHTRSQQIRDAERLRKLTGLPVTISSTKKKSIFPGENLKDLKPDKCNINLNQEEQRQKISSQSENKNHPKNILSDHDQVILGEKLTINDKAGAKMFKKDNLSLKLDSGNTIDLLDSKANKSLDLGTVKKSNYKDNQNFDCFEKKTLSSSLNAINQTKDINVKLKSRFHSISTNPLKAKTQSTKIRFDNLTNEEGDKKEKNNLLNRSVKPLQLNSVQSPLIDLSVPITKKQAAQAKMNAIKLVKKLGQIKKVDPNAIRRKKSSPKKGKKRLHTLEEEEENINEQEDRKSKLSARFLELMNATSQNEHLIEIEEQKNLEEYYNKMEKKEQLEEKMLTTFKMDCKAVKCIKCKYKWFSASELCKSEGHPLKVITAIKRFFKCANCNNRTVSLEIIPLHSCQQCGSSSWERAPMLKERKSANQELSIRGGEMKFMNSVMSNGSLNLLVPE